MYGPSIKETLSVAGDLTAPSVPLICLFYMTSPRISTMYVFLLLLRGVADLSDLQHL